MKQTSTHGKSVPDPRREALSGQHIAQLQAALLDSFSLDELAKMVRLELSFDLPAVVPVQGRTLDAITHELVVWALRKPEVGLQGLLAAAYRTNPRNPPASRTAGSVGRADLCASGVPLSRDAALHGSRKGTLLRAQR